MRLRVRVGLRLGSHFSTTAMGETVRFVADSYWVINISSFSPVAGIVSFGASSPLRYESAFFAAAQTEMPSSSGGSPTALLRRRLIALSGLSRNFTLKVAGTSPMFGIL